MEESVKVNKQEEEVGEVEKEYRQMALPFVEVMFPKVLRTNSAILKVFSLICALVS